MCNLFSTHATDGKAFVYLYTAIACLPSILLGYDVGVMGGAIVYMQNDLVLTYWDEEMIVSAFSFFAIPGALLGGELASSHGRKQTIAISSILFLIGSIIMVITTSFYIIVLGRILLGIATGVGLIIAPLYTAELSPSSIRGQLVAMAEISINTGILLGYLIAWIFYFIPVNDDTAWRTMIAFGCIPAVLLFCGIMFMPESPRWLIENDNIPKARKVLAKTCNGSMDNRIREIQETIVLERNEGEANWSDVLLPCIYKPSLMLQKALIVGCGIAFFQQSTGVDAVVYYTPLTFKDLGLNDGQVLLATTVMGASKLFFILVAMVLIDRIGRRPLLLLSSVLLTLSLIGFIFSFLIQRPIGFTIFLQCFYVSAFSIGWGPICWVMISEIFPLQIRSKGMAVATCINRLTAGIVALVFLSIQESWSPIGTWIVFVCISILALLFVYKLVPETKNKTLEEITNSLLYGFKHLDVVDRDNIYGPIGVDQPLQVGGDDRTELVPLSQTDL